MTDIFFFSVVFLLHRDYKKLVFLINLEGALWFFFFYVPVGSGNIFYFENVIFRIWLRQISWSTFAGSIVYWLWNYQVSVMWSNCSYRLCVPDKPLLIQKWLKSFFNESYEIWYCTVKLNFSHYLQKIRKKALKLTTLL